MKNKKLNLILTSVIFLAGIFMGAIDTGIVTPARTLIQNNLGVDAQTGIWMITIYTLAYAASIPVMGKLADKYGKKYIYLACITLFGIGSFLCGLSQTNGGFTLLLIARVIQAVGGGGILPIATAEFGTSFPEGKRGMALGLVGGVYGIANIFGASAGSLILDIFGSDNWRFIFFINIPIAVFIIIAGLLTLKNTKSEQSNKTDVFGIFTLTAMILSLLYGFKNLDFFDIATTIKNLNVYPFLILFVVLIPLFILIEKKAKDPVMNLKYFTDKNIVITLLISFISGIVMMGMIFVPQFSENALKIATGSGGYFVIILGTFAGVAAPVSGKLIDKLGVKLVLGFGFAVSVIGALFLIFVTTKTPNLLTVIISLMLIGIGMGFTMGTPLNYMMLENTDDKESNSALATLSLVRSIGTAIAPAIMIGFIAHAGASVQTNIMAILPKEVAVPPLPYVQDITEELEKLKENDQMKDKLAGMEMPDLTSMQTVKVDFESDSDYEMPADLLELMQNSDVTTITANSKTLADRMFKEMTPSVIADIQNGIGAGVDGIGEGISQMDETIKEMEKGKDGIGQGISGMQQAVKAQKTALAQLNKVSAMLAQMSKAQMGSAQMGSAQMGGAQTGSAQMGSAQMGSAQMGSAQMGSAQMGSTQMGNTQTGSTPTGNTQTGNTQTGNTQTGNTQTGNTPTGNTQTGNTQTGNTQTGNTQTGNAQMGNAQMPSNMTIADMIPASVKDSMPKSALAELSKIKSEKDLNKKIKDLENAISTLNSKISEAKKKQSELSEAITAMKASRAELADLSYKMTELSKAVPGAFDTAKNNYIAEIDNKNDELETTFQSTLNEGFKNVYLTGAVAAAVALLVLIFYKKKKAVEEVRAAELLSSEQ